MKHRSISAGIAGLALASALIAFVPRSSAQETPQAPQSPDSVAKPKKPQTDTTPPGEQAPIPSEYKRPKTPPADTPTFKSNATTVNVDVSVLDDHKNFIPGLQREKFRVLEDGVPQQITQFGTSDAPITICMLIEFSG